MTYADIQDQLSEYTDNELINEFKEAIGKLEAAAENEPNSEWHESCFAATFLFAEEMGKRGLSLNTAH